MATQNIWCFSFRRFIDTTEAHQLASGLEALLRGWKAHGTPVSSRVVFRYGHFLFIEATSENASGCSIDWLHQGLDGLFTQLGLQPADAATIFFWNADDEIDAIDFRELEDALASGKLSADTVVFDPQAVQQGEFERWEVPLVSTWMARYLKAGVR